jgi:lysozyme-related protein Hpa2
VSPSLAPSPIARSLQPLLIGIFAAHALLFAAVPAHADCIDAAAVHHRVNAHVLRAIGWHESRLRPSAMNVNANGSTDIGAFQINTIHLPKLRRYGIDEAALKNGCVAAYVGAWHYKKQVEQFGNTWAAVGAYHSRTPARSAWYANQIATVLMRWQVLPAGRLPYVDVPLLAASQPNLSAPPGVTRVVVVAAAAAATPLGAVDGVARDPR